MQTTTSQPGVNSGTLAGVIAPVLTPFDSRFEVDTPRFLAHCRWLLAHGCSALAPFGTTSEATSLSTAERRRLLEEMVQGGIDPALLLPGTGTCSLAETLDLTRQAVELGCAGVLTLPPFYYKSVSDEGLFAYFSSLIDKLGDDRLRVYLYHIPPIAQVGFSLPLVSRLIEAYPGIVVGLKDSSGDWSNTRAMIEAQPDFAVFPGSEAFLLDGLRSGMSGCISATVNVNPGAIREVFDSWQAPEADELQAGITAARKAVQSYPLVQALKYLLAHYLGDPEWRRTRPPFQDLPEEQGQALVAALEGELGFRMAAE